MKDSWSYIKRNFYNENGSISTRMGTDLFATLLLVFLISTALLLKTAKNNVSSVAETRDKEARTPEVNLAQDDQGVAGIGREGATFVSARSKPDRTVEYFVGDEKTDLQGMAALIKDKGTRRVELRLAEDLTNSVTVKILGQLQQAGVKEIYYVFIKKQKGEG